MDFWVSFYGSIRLLMCHTRRLGALIVFILVCFHLWRLYHFLSRAKAPSGSNYFVNDPLHRLQKHVHCLLKAAAMESQHFREMLSLLLLWYTKYKGLCCLSFAYELSRTQQGKGRGYRLAVCVSAYSYIRFPVSDIRGGGQCCRVHLKSDYTNARRGIRTLIITIMKWIVSILQFLWVWPILIRPVFEPHLSFGELLIILWPVPRCANANWPGNS